MWYEFDIIIIYRDEHREQINNKRAHVFIEGNLRLLPMLLALDLVLLLLLSLFYYYFNLDFFLAYFFFDSIDSQLSATALA